MIKMSEKEFCQTFRQNSSNLFCFNQICTHNLTATNNLLLIYVCKNDLSRLIQIAENN